MKTMSLYRPWVFALIGASMIILSTFISGVIAFNKEQTLLDIQKEVDSIRAKRQDADWYGLKANLGFDLTYLQRSVVKYSIFQDESTQESWGKAFAASLYVSVLDSYYAVGRYLSEGELDDLKALTERAKDGDKKAVQELVDTSAELAEAHGQYASKLIIEEEATRHKAEAIKKDIVTTRNWALFFQIIGLILLLTKEFPTKRSRSTS